MPKVTPLTRRPKWEIDMLTDIASAQALTGKSYRQICAAAQIKYEAFMLHIREPRQMREGELHDFLEACERIGGTR